MVSDKAIAVDWDVKPQIKQTKKNKNFSTVFIVSFTALVKGAYQKIHFLISQPNIYCGCSKEPSQ